MQTAVICRLHQDGIKRSFSAKQFRIRKEADAPEIQAIGVPTSPHCHIRALQSVAMIAAGFDQSLQLACAYAEIFSAEITSEIPGAVAVKRVVIIIPALRIMQEGEELDNSRIGAVDTGKAQAVGPDSGPMRQAVDALPIQPELRF